ncbi:MAG: M1 family metallopeptidase [Anaerolineales bacterium]
MTLRRSALMLSLVFLLGSCRAGLPVARGIQTNESPATPVKVQDPLLQPWDDFDLFRSDLVLDEPVREAPLKGATIYHLDIHLEEDLKSLTGLQELRFTNPTDAILETIYLRLFPNLSGGRMVVDRIEADGRPCQYALQSGGSVLSVVLPEGLLPGRSLTLQLSFMLELPTTMEGNYGLFGYHDGILLLQEFFPMIPALTQQGWAIDVPPPFGDLTCQPASYYLMRLQLPKDLTLISSGVVVAADRQGTDQVVLIAAGPARDLYVAAGRDFATEVAFAGETRLISYASPKESQTAKQVNEITTAALDIFEELLSPYPYTELETFATPMQALGMEYPGVIALTERMYDPSATISGIPGPAYLEGTVVHEVAHQWFYNLVGNDQVNSPWLDEALVQYMTGLYFRARYGEQGYDQFRTSWLDRWDRVDRRELPIGLPSADYTGTEYGAIVYGRGPLFIEALAEFMGQDAFAEFLKAYVGELRWKISSSTDFLRLAESTCGCDLEPLMAAWVFPP